MPTLLEKGRLVAPKTAPPGEQERLNTYLPVDYVVEWFASRENKTGIANRVLILKSETASGKSTLLPPAVYKKMVYEKPNHETGPGLICTQPRTITAMSNVNEILKYQSSWLKRGKNIGWSTQANKIRPQKYGLLSATVGTLTQQLKTLNDDELIKTYRVIMIDETHERDLQTDMCIYMLKNFMKRVESRRDCPFLALMSATFEPDTYLSYFNLEEADNFIYCRGASAGHTEHYNWTPLLKNKYSGAYSSGSSEHISKSSDHVTYEAGLDEMLSPISASSKQKSNSSGQKNNPREHNNKSGEQSKENKKKDIVVHDVTAATLAVKAVEIIVSGEGVNDAPGKGDIMIFVPGAMEFMKISSKLRSLNEREVDAGREAFTILFVDGMSVRKGTNDYKNVMFVDIADQTEVIRGKRYKVRRRVIVTTSVAETGLTLGGLKYVIDLGFNKEVEYNPEHDINMLITKFAPRSRIIQRRGRCGRLFPGVFYPIYTRDVFNMLPENQLPAILSSNPISIIPDMISEQLRAKYLDGQLDPIFDPRDIDMLDLPGKMAIDRSMRKLYKIGLLTAWASPYTEPTVQDGKTRVGMTQLGRDIEAITFQATSKHEKLRMIIAAFSWRHSVLDMISITAYLNIMKSSLLRSSSDDEKPINDAVSEQKSDNAEEVDEVVEEVKKESKPPTPLNWSVIYSEGLPKFAQVYGGVSWLRMRVLIADEFIEGLILVNAIRKQFSESSDYNKCMMKLKKFCYDANMSVDGALLLLKEREDIITEMLACTVDVFRHDEASFSLTNETNFMTAIARIKHCIYDGFRCNLLTLRDGFYYTTSNLQVKTPAWYEMKSPDDAEIAAIKPKYMLFESLEMRLNNKTSVEYLVKAIKISAMDGFVAVDESF